MQTGLIMQRGYDFPLKLNRCNAETTAVQLWKLSWKRHILRWFCDTAPNFAIN